jgi:hypothetical protein
MAVDNIFLRSGQRSFIPQHPLSTSVYSPAVRPLGMALIMDGPCLGRTLSRQY